MRLNSRWLWCGLAVVLLVVSSGCGRIKDDDTDRALCIIMGGRPQLVEFDDDEEWDDLECDFSNHPKSAAASQGEVMLIPAAAHVSGALGTDWRSDVELSNLADETALVDLVLLRKDADNSSANQVSVSIAGGESVRLGDVLESEFNRDGQAALALFVQSGRVVATSRTFNLLAAGNPLGLPGGSTFGQYIPALPKTDAIRHGEQGRLIQLSHSTATDGGFRANLGAVNLTPSDLHVDIGLHDGDGALLGTVPVDLQPFGYTQINRVFERVTSGDVFDGYAVVTTSTEEGRFLAYASVVDNLTGDPIAIPAARLPEQPSQDVGDAIWVVAAAHVAGAAGTNWRTDLEVHNWGDTSADYTIALLEHGAENSEPESRSYTLAAGACERFEDFLAREFAFDGQAALRIIPSDGNILVTSRTYNLLGVGNPAGLPAGATFGQYIPGVGAEQAIRPGEEGHLIQLSHNLGGASGFRTNLVLVNGSYIEIEVEVEALRSDGTSLGVVSKSLAPLEYRQLNRVFEEVTSSEVADGMLVVRTTTENGEVFALASVVDNLTGDPVGVGALVVSTVASGSVIDQYESINDMLGQTTIEDTVGGIQTAGVDPILDSLVDAWPPGVANRTSGGVVANFGTGTVMPDGTVWSGSSSIDASGLVVSEDGVSGTVRIVNDVTIDGEPSGMDSVAWTVDVEEREDGTVVGTISAEPIGGSAAPGAIGGTIVVDTAICEKYPIAGSLTVVVDGEVVTIAPSPDCDGSFTDDVLVMPSGFDFVFTSADPWDPRSNAFITSTSNAEVATEGDLGGGYWRPMMGAETFAATTPGVITFHYGFDRPISGGNLVLTLATFHFWYSRGHAFLYGSTDGGSWQQLVDLAPPEEGTGRGGGWNGPLPAMFIGAEDIWLQVRLYSYGPEAPRGGVYCNTAQMFRYDPRQTANTFELMVDLVD